MRGQTSRMPLWRHWLQSTWMRYGPAITCYSKAEFKPVGVLRGYGRRQGRESANGLLMGMLISDRP